MRKLSEINERLWTTAVNRGIEGRAKKEDGTTYKKWGESITLHCSKEVFEYILHHILFWRNDYDLDTGPDSHWNIYKNTHNIYHSVSVNLLKHNPNVGYFSIDKYKDFIYAEEEWYDIDFNESNYDLDESDYNKIINFILNKIKDMTFVVSDSFNNIYNTDSSDSYGILLYEFNEIPEDDKLSILKDIQDYFKSLNFDAWYIKEGLVIEDKYIIMRVYENLFNHYDEVISHIPNIVSKYI